MNRLRNFIRQSALYQLFEPFIPVDHHRTCTAEDHARRLLAQYPGPVRVLDLGCGAGATMELFRGINAQCSWQGAEVEGSPELRAAAPGSRPITFFDGTSLPWDDGCFDLVYSHQVLEHVRRPEALLADVFRVLKPGGAFVGSASYLEPYHSLSLFNYTPHGLLTVLRDAGFTVAELRPGHDCFCAILRQMVGGSPGLSKLLQRLSPLNAAVAMAYALCGFDHRACNFIKIQFAGHLCFLAYKAQG